MPAKVRSFSVGSAFLDDVFVAKPSGAAVGDDLWAFAFSDWEISGSTLGWQQVAHDFDASQPVGVRILRKTVGANEPSTYQFTGFAAASSIVHVVCVTGADPLVSPQVTIGIAFSETADTPDVRPVAASSLEFRAAGVLSDSDATLTWQAPSGYTLRGSRSQGDMSSAVASRQVNSSTPSGRKSFILTPAVARLLMGVSVSIASADTTPDTGPPPPPFTPGRGSSPYRFVMTKWDGTYLDDLDLTSVSFDKRIGQSGSFSASIPITSSKVRDRVARVISPDPSQLGTGPGVVTCQIYRGGVCWGEYWITTASISKSGREAPSISLTGTTMDAYLTQVEIQEALNYAGADQIDIARGLIESMQSRDNANLRLITQDGTSGVSRDIAYAANEGTYGQRLQELAQADNGFEWVVNTVAGVNGLERNWVWGSPTLGNGQVKHVFSDAPYGGDILAWTEEIDALRGGTYWRARGDSTSSDASTAAASLMSEPVLATAHLAAGWPRLDRTITYSNVSDPSTLDDYAAYWAANAGGALRVDSVTVALGALPTFTPNSLGDTARIFLHNEWHPPQSRVRRIIGIGITPPSRDGGKEIAQLIFEGIEVPSGG